jgi:hypothetical protein
MLLNKKLDHMSFHLASVGTAVPTTEYCCCSYDFLSFPGLVGGSTISSLPKEMRRGLNPLMILVSREVWKHRDGCVFLGSSPQVSTLLRTVVDECILWCMTGASCLQELLARSLTMAV